MIQISLTFVSTGPFDDSIGSDNGLAPNRRQAITRTNADPVHRRIYAVLAGDELIPTDTMRHGSRIYN